MRKIYTSALVLAAVALSGESVQAQRYSDIYYALPDMTLDQAYCALMEFQKANPYHANTYLQLGSICEKKMILLDPLRDNKSVVYWGQSVALFYGNLKVFYKEGEARGEFYQNLKIPFSGRRIEDADFWAFVEQHKAMAKNHVDTTSMIFAAIEKSKHFYDRSIETYKSICDDYVNMNDLLLRNDEALNKRMADLVKYSDLCVKEFAEYKRLINLYPVMNYKQFYEKLPIETFRLDGLTNSDFYQNRFNIWDFGAWVEEYRAAIRDFIEPLRKEIKAIDDKYRAGRSEFQSGAAQSAVLSAPYDDMFLFRLGRYDNASIVRELFGYLESTRKMLVLAGDSIGRNIPWSSALEARKMRQIYRISKLAAESDAKRKALLKGITADNVGRFANFFATSYGGHAGLVKFAKEDGEFCESVLATVCDATAQYLADLDQSRKAAVDVYSVAQGAAAPSVPLWAVQDVAAITSKHSTTHISYGKDGTPAHVAGCMKANAKSWFVAGIKDGKTDWLLNLKGVNGVSGVRSFDGGCLVNALRQLKPTLILVNEVGKEVKSVDTGTEFLDIMECDPISGRIYWASGNEQRAPALASTDSLGVKAWDVKLAGLSSVASVNIVSDGFLSVGLSADGQLASVLVSASGEVKPIVNASAGVSRVISVSRISANEIGCLVEGTDGKRRFVLLSDKGAVI